MYLLTSTIKITILVRIRTLKGGEKMPRPRMITRTFDVTICHYLEFNEETEVVTEVTKDIVKPFNSSESLLKYLQSVSKPGYIPIKIISTEEKRVFKGMSPEYFYSQSKELENRNNKVKERKKRKK